MNEELQKALGALLNKANDGIDAASGFLTAELPYVIQQLLMWHGVYNFILMLVGTAFIYVPFKYARVLLNTPDSEKENYIYRWDSHKNTHKFKDEELTTLFVVVGGFSSFFALVAVVTFVNIEWLQILIAPKVWLLEYAANLAK